MTRTISVCMSGSSTKLYDALERHLLPTRGVVAMLGEPQCAAVELPDTNEVRARLKGLAIEMHASLMAVSVTTLYDAPTAEPSR